MRRLPLLLALCLLVPRAFAIENVAPFDDPAMQDRYEHIVKELRCLVCQNESIADSAAPVAADLRREVHRLVSEGKSDAEVKDFLSSRYGDFVLYRPRIAPVTYALWGGPFVFLVIGAVVFWRVLQKRRAQPLDLDEDAST